MVGEKKQAIHDESWAACEHYSTLPLETSSNAATEVETPIFVTFGRLCNFGIFGLFEILGILGSVGSLGILGFRFQSPLRQHLARVGTHDMEMLQVTDKLGAGLPFGAVRCT